MRGRVTGNDDLPDGIVKLPRQSQAPGGCGGVGCLYGFVGLFVVLLIAMLLIVLFRVWQTPVILR